MSSNEVKLLMMVIQNLYAGFMSGFQKEVVGHSVNCGVIYVLFLV